MDVLIHVNSKEEELETQINLDELYERKQVRDLNTLESYNKILNRIHTRIKTVARHQINEQFCWFIVPEVMIGIPKFDHGACVAYLLDKLQDNGFNVRYTHPNLIFISWKHWVPSYVRNEFKKKTGLIVDGFGKPIENNTNKKNTNIDSNEDFNLFNINKKNDDIPVQNKKSFKDINSYKPSGNLVYNNDQLKKLDFKNSL
tara:strand:- start:446 stop:1048 length:603 start_codon:yes stop_codon:yes gene_type:complete